MKHYKGLLLVSSGIDSPVAGYLMKKRDVEVIAVHFDNSPYSSEKSLEKTKKLIKKIGIKKLYVAPLGKVVQKELTQIYRRFQCVLCRRMMFRIAERIAEKERCDFLITGENLGQVASQTIENLTTAMQAVKIPIVRPLLTNDKNETVAIARKIGTYEISIEKDTPCKLAPTQPHTKAPLDRILAKETVLNIPELISISIKNSRVESL